MVPLQRVPLQLNVSRRAVPGRICARCFASYARLTPTTTTLTSRRAALLELWTSSSNFNSPLRTRQPADSTSGYSGSYTQVRRLWLWDRFKGKNKADDTSTPGAADQETKPKMPDVPKSIERGSLAKSSIFDSEKVDEEESDKIVQEQRLDESMSPFMRAMRIKEIKRRGRLTKKQRIAQTEKEHVLRSDFFKTSLKKLAPLARQIAEKPLDHALTQMKFSKKKSSRKIIQLLETARAEASVTKGFDISQTYISQAWVGRGTDTHSAKKRARGRWNKLTHPTTCISVMLKEQSTKDRIASEKEAKRLNKKPWVQLASRPIYGQHQYYTW